MSDVVCFKLINGNEIVGKHVSEKNHKDFIRGEDVIYLDDAVFIGIQKMQDGNAGIAFAPLTGIGDNPQADKAQLPFALYRNTILGQLPLDPDINKMYREATTGIALVR